MTKKFNAFDDNGNKWCVRVVFDGDKYGRDMCLTHDEHEPMIEFYDADYDFDLDTDGSVLGQFVSRYYAETLLEDYDEDFGIGHGINLDGGVPKWSIDRHTYEDILREAKEIIEGVAA